MKFSDALTHAVKKMQTPEFIKRIQEEDPTMHKHMAIIREINELGFLTDNSQAGKRTSGKHYQSGVPYEIVERAYISGFMKRDAAIAFIRNMALHTDKNAMHVPFCGTEPYKTGSGALDIPLTAVTMKGVTTIETHMSTTISKLNEPHIRAQVNLNKRDPVVYVFCWDSQWCRKASGQKGLFADVLRVLKRGLKEKSP